MADSNADKTLAPTSHRRQEARKRGQVVQSQDVGSAALLLGGLMIMMALGGPLVEYLARLTADCLGGKPCLSVDPQSVVSQWICMVGGLATVLLPVLGLLCLLSAAVSLLQIGWLFLPDRVAPDLSRLNPITGLRRIFAPASFVRLGLGLLKIAVIGSVALWSLYERRGEVLALSALDPPQIARVVWEVTLSTGLKIGVALLGLAALDYLYQRWRHEQSLKMTPQELRDELRILEGDPKLTARRQSIRRQTIQQGSIGAVRRASVVLTNVAGTAVALEYDKSAMKVPRVVVKAAGVTAEHICSLARQQGVPIMECPGLVDDLYRQVDASRAIPDRLYPAIAKVLSDFDQARQ